MFPDRVHTADRLTVCKKPHISHPPRPWPDGGGNGNGGKG